MAKSKTRRDKALARTFAIDMDECLASAAKMTQILCDSGELDYDRKQSNDQSENPETEGEA